MIELSTNKGFVYRPASRPLLIVKTVIYYSLQSYLWEIATVKLI